MICSFICHGICVFSASDRQLKYHGYPARIGYVLKGVGYDTLYEEDLNSGHWSMYLSRPNCYRISDKATQVHGLEGRIAYRLTRENVTNPRVQCDNWYQVGDRTQEHLPLVQIL